MTWKTEENSDLITFISPEGFRFCYHNYLEVMSLAKSLIGRTDLFWTNYGDSIEISQDGDMFAITCDAWTNKGFEGKYVGNIPEFGNQVINYIASKNDASARL